MEPYHVHQKIKKMKSNSATVVGDIPNKVIKMFGYELFDYLISLKGAVSVESTLMSGKSNL